MICKVKLPHSVQEVVVESTVRWALLRDAGYEVSADLSVEECNRLAEKEGFVGAQVDGQIVELDFHITGDCTVAPLTIDDYFGRHIVMRSASTLLMYIARQVAPQVSLEVGQSLHSQLFFNVQGAEDPVRLGELLNKRFKEMVKGQVPFMMRMVPPSVALRRISDPDGARRVLVHCWVGERFGLVRLGDYYELAHGPFVPTTGFLESIKVVGLPEGLLLACEPVKLPSPEFKSFMLGAAKQAKDWNKRMGIETMGKLNEMILRGEGHNLVQVSETFHELRIGEIASQILERPQVKVVFISGPSSSGKTSTVRRLSTHFQAMGKQTCYVGLDDYYLAREFCPVDENGEHDFESLQALNVERIKSDLASLVEGRKTAVPRFDFPNQRPFPPEDERIMQIGEDQILLVEGIHGLNPELTKAIPPERRFTLFVSSMPQLALDANNRVPTTYARLLRRIIRDRRYRGTTASSTIRRWPSVRRGENKYIFPYQSLADAMFNSALAYELAVFRTFAWPYLLEVLPNDPAYAMARDMLRFLPMVVPMDTEWVPKNSVLREFLGGSIYQY